MQRALQIVTLTTRANNNAAQPEFAINAAIREAVKDLEKKFKTHPVSEKIALQCAKLKIDDLNKYNTKCFDSVDEIEAVLRARSKKIRTTESVENSLRKTTMSEQDLESYVMKMRNLLSLVATIGKLIIFSRRKS